MIPVGRRGGVICTWGLTGVVLPRLDSVNSRLMMPLIRYVSWCRTSEACSDHQPEAPDAGDVHDAMGGGVSHQVQGPEEGAGSPLIHSFCNMTTSSHSSLSWAWLRSCRKPSRMISPSLCSNCVQVVGPLRCLVPSSGATSRRCWASTSGQIMSTV